LAHGDAEAAGLGAGALEAPVFDGTDAFNGARALAGIAKVEGGICQDVSDRLL
jgi:hypothetical protein